jgi:hypothetical protein
VSPECPDGTRILTVQPNFGTFDELHWQNLPLNGCGNRRSGVIRPVSATPTPPTATIPPTVGAPFRPADAGPFDVRFSWYGGAMPTGYFDPQLLSWVFDEGALTGGLTGGGTAVMIGTGGLISSASLTLHWFEGEVAGCGSGSMVIRYAMDPSRYPGASSWEIVPGLGAGDLATVTGHGTSKQPNGFTGTVDCHGFAPNERPAFATTLLSPPTDQGVEAFVPAHSAVRLVIDDVLFPGFAGAWDLAPGLNGDAAGGGPIIGPGRVNCTRG